MTGSLDLLVDGRVLTGRSTGIQRVARGLLDGAALDATVVAPAPCADPRVSRVVRSVHPQVWEQVQVPALARGRTVLSLANTAPLLARRSVVFVHDLAPLHHPEWFAPRMRWYARTVVLSARRAAHVLTPSEMVRRELVELGVPLSRSTCVRPAVTVPESPPDVDGVRERLGLRLPYAVLVGWADPRKDLATALAASRAVRPDVPHDLVLLGSTHPNLAPVAAPPDARVLGHLPDADLQAVLAGAQVLLHPSRYEGFGLPPLEAWAVGTPALVGDVASVREATLDRAPVLPLGDVTAWTAALRSALLDPPAVPALPAWTWADAGALLRAVLEDL